MSPTMQKLAKRTAMLAAVGVILTQMLPSLADQLTPNPVVENAAPESSPEPEPIVTITAEPVAQASGEPTAEVTYLPIETPTVKAKVIESRSLFFKVPNSVQVDPRATSVRFSSVALGGSEDVLVCISSSRANISLSQASGVLTSGQGTHHLVVSGSAPSVLAALTSGHGIAGVSQGRISGSTITIAVAAMNKPAADLALCGGAQITRTLAVTALGLDMNTVKTGVNMGKK